MRFEAKFYDKNGVVFFNLKKAAITTPAIDFEFDGPATDRHKKDYSSQFQKYLDLKNKTEHEMEAASEPPSLLKSMGDLINGVFGNQ